MAQNNYKTGIDCSLGTHLKSEGSTAQDLYSVKEVCNQTGLSRKQLFDYQEIVRPIGHSKSGYKLYDLKGIRQLKMIAELRDIDVSLAEIRLVVDGSKTKEEIIKNQINVLNERKRFIDSMLILAEKMLAQD